MRDESKRTDKYEKKLSPDVIKQRYDAEKDLMVGQQIDMLAKMVNLETQVKTICKDVPTPLLFFYHAYAKELFKVAKEHGASFFTFKPIFDKWVGRGLKKSLLCQIAQRIFGVLLPCLEPKIWLRYEETSGNIAHDSSGYGNDATVTNAVWSPNGVVGRCIRHIDGTSQVITNRPLFNIPEGGGMTVCMWVKRDNPGETARYIMRTEIGGGPAQWGFYTSGNLLYIITGNVSHGEGSLIQDYNWHFLSFVLTHEYAKLYCDGVETGSSPVHEPINGNGNLYLGHIPGFGMPGILGYYDEFMYFDRVLTLQEIQFLYSLKGY